MGKYRYYLSLIMEIFQTLARWRGMSLLAVCIIVAVLMFFNAPLGQQIIEHWNGFNPAWGILPIGFGGAWLFLDLNYQHYADAQEKIKSLHYELRLLKEPVGKAFDVLFIPKWAKSVRTAKDGNLKGLVVQLDVTNKSYEEFYATPRIRFSDASGRVFKIEGLWSDQDIPERKSTIRPPMKFLAGERHKLDLAIQFNGEKDWYGIDSASPYGARYRYEKYKLSGEVHIIVTLEGNMIPITRYFQLKEENGIFKFDEI